MRRPTFVAGVLSLLVAPAATYAIVEDLAALGLHVPAWIYFVASVLVLALIARPQPDVVRRKYAFYRTDVLELRSPR